ncbi:MAG: 1-deoxy-D-xylulose-5-phosphate reductoisomerase [Anaerotruncus sp.]|nr:1-deoxy-D-xylulose-5-phosphate reductoisomerase [Anaerotruncus sp.]
MKKNITVLGSTGSIGTQTLHCCKRLGYPLVALAANRSTTLLEAQAREFSPRYVAVVDENAYQDLKVRLADTNIRLLSGVQGLCEVAALPENDIVCNAVVGMVGLRPTLAAIEAGNTLALANKETLVAGGQLVMEAAAQNNVSILPVDSEHSAIFQCLQGNERTSLHKLLLTASGGPFRGKTAAELEQVTLEQALHHPNWEMGAKITVDSSTLMNKGLEFIEAMWLFDVTPNRIEVVVHPQSVVHSAVEFQDGSIIAQLGVPDMAIPIQYALTYPHRALSSAKPLSLVEYGSLTFEPPDLKTFVCLDYAMEAARRGGLYPCAVNSANEQAVALFLDGKIGYGEIGRSIGYVLEHFSDHTARYCIEDIFSTDLAARALVLEYCRGLAEYYTK